MHLSQLHLICLRFLQGYRSVNLRQFAALSSSLSLRPDLYLVMATYASADVTGSLTLSPEQLQCFLVNEQKMDATVATIEYCASLIKEVSLQS